MIERGYLAQIVVSQDVATKMDTRRYGGWGYSHFTEHVEPILLKAGVTAEEIHVIRIGTPSRLLSIGVTPTNVPLPHCF
jgi:phosphotriesterase-related protein